RRAPGYSALGNSKDNLKDTLLFVAPAAAGPCVRKVCLINSFYISQRRDEFGEIFNARPLFIRFADRRLHHDGLSRCVHFERGGRRIVQCWTRARRLQLFRGRKEEWRRGGGFLHSLLSVPAQL